MRKLFFVLTGALLLCFTLCGGGRFADAAASQYYLGGMTAGFLLSANGVEVIGLKEVISENGVSCPAADAGIRTGDKIVAVDGIHTKTIEDLGAALERGAGKSSEFTLRRGGLTIKADVTPVKDKKGTQYKIGVLIRDELSGIGTVTYIEKGSGRFGSLGHAVCDEERDSLSIADASVYLCSIIGVNRGERGRAGDLKGLFLSDYKIASADKVCETGLYGTFDDGYDCSALPTVEIAPLSAATIGSAVIYSTVDGTVPQAYDVAIAKVDPNNKQNKNFVIKVTDEELLRETGGIVQGMSGSPIVQDGKFIGAVTHVFLNDPTRGYGIGIEKMIGN